MTSAKVSRGQTPRHTRKLTTGFPLPRERETPRTTFFAVVLVCLDEVIMGSVSAGKLGLDSATGRRILQQLPKLFRNAVSLADNLSSKAGAFEIRFTAIELLSLVLEATPVGQKSIM